MKKALLFAVLSSAGLGSGAAAAYPTGTAHTIDVIVTGPTSAGAITAAGVFNTGTGPASGCLYPVTWQSPFTGGNTVTCILLETRTATGPNCSANAKEYTPGAFLSTVSPPGPFQSKGGPASGCAGFDPNGNQYVSGIVISAVEGAGGARGMISYPAPFGGLYAVTL